MFKSERKYLKCLKVNVGIESFINKASGSALELAQHSLMHYSPKNRSRLRSK